MARTETVSSAARVLDVLVLLLKADYATGMTPGEIAKTQRLSASAVTRYLGTLEDRGCIERILESGRVRPSVGLVRHALAILTSLDASARRAQEMAARLATPL